MSNRIRHLEEGDLLKLIDGELPVDAASDARAHIESCWSCRTQFQEIETAIGEYVRYQKAADPWLPPPPDAWPELQFRPAAAEPRPEPPALLMLSPRRWFDLRWALAAAAVVVALVVVVRLQKPPVVTAAGLLREASAAEPVTGAIRIRTGTRIVVRPAVLTRVSGDDDARLREMFERAHFNWEQPLNARTFAAWRDQLPDKEDDVRVEKDVYVIRTSTRSSELHRATMTLRARDLRPVHEMLEFTGETVELEPAPEATTPPAGPEQVAASPARASKLDVSPESALHHMLQVFSALHGLGADLGEPVEIRQNDGNVEVTAIGLPASRQQQLRSAFEGMPYVTVHFDSGLPPATSTPRRAKAPASNAPHDQTRLETILGSAQAAEDFTDRALDASDAVLARVHALRALARAFPPAQESALGPSDRSLLAEMRNDHTTALQQKIANLRNVLQPVIANSSNAAGPADTAATWQDAAQKLFIAAQHLDETLNRELAGTGADSSGFGLIAQGLSQLDRQAALVTRHGYQ